MYSEKTYKNYIFWTQVKRIVVIIILSCLGALIGVLITKILESTVKITSFNNVIISVSTIIFFLLALLLTVGTGRQVQDGYWKIAVLRKLTVIQKNLELNNELLKNNGSSVKDKNEYYSTKMNSGEDEIKPDEDYDANIYKFNDEMLPVPKEQKKGFRKKLKKPEDLI